MWWWKSIYTSFRAMPKFYFCDLQYFTSSFNIFRGKTFGGVRFSVCCQNKMWQSTTVHIWVNHIAQYFVIVSPLTENTIKLPFKNCFAWVTVSHINIYIYMYFDFEASFIWKFQFSDDLHAIAWSIYIFLDHSTFVHYQFKYAFSTNSAVSLFTRVDTKNLLCLTWTLNNQLFWLIFVGISVLIQLYLGFI